MRVRLPIGISIDLVDGWFDVTDDMPAGAPFTLARADGAGAFQLSAGAYASGAMPDVGVEQLRDMLVAFGRDRGLGAPVDTRVHVDRVSSVGGSFDQADFTRAWYVSDGRSFVFASHTSAQNAPDELEDCESMIRGVAFENA
jgi:hypothetical protein